MIRVLFVDDETALLDGLRGRLRARRSSWEMVFVESAARAIAEMEMKPVQVIVADMRMPRMDGPDLLTVVRERWPETIRFVLSGYAEQEQSERLLGLAHQYLSKPCDCGVLEEAIEQAVQAQELLPNSPLRKVVGALTGLPVNRAVHALACAQSAAGALNSRDLYRTISGEPPIAAKLMHAVNAGFAGSAQRTSHLEGALAHLGGDALHRLLTSTGVFSFWPEPPVNVDLTPQCLAERGQRVASAAAALCNDAALREDAHLAGLLHNIGHWMLLRECPQQMAYAVELCRGQGLTLPCAEEQVFGVSHAQVGASLLGLWGLPRVVVDAVANQYSRPACARFGVQAVLQTAKVFSATGQPWAAGIHDEADGVDSNYWRSLNAPFDWPEAMSRLEHSRQEYVR